MPAFETVSDWRESRHGPACDDWRSQSDFLAKETPSDAETVGDHRRFLAQHAADGVICQACAQTVQVNKVCFGWKHAMGLDTLVRMYALEGVDRHEYIHLTRRVHARLAAEGVDTDIIQTLLGGGGVPTHLRWYGLIESRNGEDGELETRSGFYRLTQAGALVYKGSRVPKHIYVFNKKIWQISESRISIQEAWGVRFRMKDVFPNRPDVMSLPWDDEE